MATGEVLLWVTGIAAIAAVVAVIVVGVVFTKSRRVRGFVPYYHNEMVRALTNPATQAMCNWLVGQNDELHQRVAGLENNQREFWERFDWAVYRDGAPFVAHAADRLRMLLEEQDRIAAEAHRAEAEGRGPSQLGGGQPPTEDPLRGAEL